MEKVEETNPEVLKILEKFEFKFKRGENKSENIETVSDYESEEDSESED